MTPETVMNVGRQALELTLLIFRTVADRGAGRRVCW